MDCILYTYGNTEEFMKNVEESIDFQLKMLLYIQTYMKEDEVRLAEENLLNSLLMIERTPCAI